MTDASTNPAADGDLSLPAVLTSVLDLVQVPVPAGVLRALASTLAPEQNVTAERLGRIAQYEERSFLKARRAPRFCWALTPDGGVASPRIWARGDWRLARRIVTEEALDQWQTGLALVLSQWMAEGSEATRAQLQPVAMGIVADVAGAFAVYPPGSQAEWAELHRVIAARQHGLGPDATSDAQNHIAGQLEEQLTAYNRYFGLKEPSVLPRGDDYPPRIRLALDSEPGRPFDELVLERAGSPAAAREVFAYIQEWDRLSDELQRSPTPSEYAERWRVSGDTMRQRDAAFRQVFPTETTPERIMRLLWSQLPSDGDFIRMLGRPVVETDGLPTVINHFVNCLAFELRHDHALGSAVYRSAFLSDDLESSPSRELRRFFALCERAFRTWSAKALLAENATHLVDGLLSIGGVYDEQTASYAEGMLGEYRRQLPQGAPRRLLLAAQKALRSAAAVDVLNPPATTAPYLLGIQWAAKALAEAKADEIPLDPIEEVSEVTRLLNAVH